MIEIARTLRVLGGGLVAGVIGVTAFAGATASADPLVPAPPAPAVPGVPALVAPAAPAAPVQNATALPAGGAIGNTAVAPPPASYPASAGTAAAPGTAAAAPLPPTAITPVSGTLRDYLQSKGVKLVAEKPDGFKALDITLPVPPRWTRVPDPNVPDAFAVIADRLGSSLYTSNAQVVVYKLVGNFDPREAMAHGFGDSQQLLAWQTTNASQADFAGFPSSVIEGTYRQNDMTLNTSRRNIIATSGADKYLVSFAVTTDAATAVADGPATDAIINGFRVIAPGAIAPVAPSAPFGPAPVAATPTPAPVGLPAQAAPVATAPMAAPAPAQQPMPNPLAALVPGLPPLPNLHLNLLGSAH